MLFLLILGLSLHAQATVPDSAICELSITHPNNQNGACSAVSIGKGRLLTAAHCFPFGSKTVQNGLIIATCGSAVITQFSTLVQSPHWDQSLAEDIAVLEFKDRVELQSLRPAGFESLYFKRGTLIPLTQCSIVSPRGSRIIPYPLQTFTGPDRASSVIAMRDVSGRGIPENLTVKHGESGGALICQRTPKSIPALIGIIGSFGRSPQTGKIIQNSFSPTFGPRAVGMIWN